MKIVQVEYKIERLRVEEYNSFVLEDYYNKGYWKLVSVKYGEEFHMCTFIREMVK